MKALAILPPIILCFASCSAQENVVRNQGDYLGILRKAEQEVASNNLKVALPLWEEVVKQNPVNHRYWHYLGNCYLAVSDYKNAIQAFEKSDALTQGHSYWESFSLAKAYTLMGDREAGLKWAVNAFDLGLPERTAFNDAAFTSLRSLPEFQRIAGTTNISKLTRVEGWRYDLKFLQDEITRKAYHEVPREFTKAALDAEVKKIHDAIPSLTDLQITVRLANLLVKVNDGHSQLYGWYENAELIKCIPVEFFWFREGLYVVQADKRFANLLGSKVVSIEGKTPEEIFAEMDPIINRDNPMGPKVLGGMRVRHPGLLHAMGISKSPDEMSLSLIDTNGKPMNMTLKADSNIPSRKLWDGLPGNWQALENTIPKKPEYLEDRNSPYWYKYSESDKTIWFHYNNVFDVPNKPWRGFVDELFRFIENNPVEKLVIDYRNNNGGNGELTYPLLHQLIRCDKINQRGKLFIITGRKTFSAAGISISLLEKHTNATFIGEPAGTSPVFTGEEFPFELPYSHITGNVSDRAHRYANSVDFRAWIPPLIYIEPSYNDFIKGYDPVVDAVRDFK